jgi:hypothetical protein
MDDYYLKSIFEQAELHKKQLEDISRFDTPLKQLMDSYALRPSLGERLSEAAGFNSLKDLQKQLGITSLEDVKKMAGISAFEEVQKRAELGTFDDLKSFVNQDVMGELQRLASMTHPTKDQFLDMQDAAKSLSGLLNETSDWNAAIYSAKSVHPSWLAEQYLNGDRAEAILEFMTKERLVEASRYSSLAAQLVESSHFDALNELNALKGLGIHSLQDSFYSLGQSYDQLVASVATTADLLRLPEHTLPGAGGELILAGHAIRTINPAPYYEEEGAVVLEEYVPEEEGEETCIIILEDIHPPLAEMYRGAQAAIISSHPDHARHALTSMRELVTKVIHLLAPTDAVLAWVPDDKMLHKGRPKRRARLAYILRDINHGGLTSFIEAKIKCTLELFNTFQRLHEDNPNLTKTQLQALLLNVSHLVEFLFGFHSRN